MSLINRFLSWRIRWNHARHKRWLRHNRVLLPKPQEQCRRGTPECAGKV